MVPEKSEKTLSKTPKPRSLLAEFLLVFKVLFVILSALFGALVFFVPAQLSFYPAAFFPLAIGLSFLLQNRSRKIALCSLLLLGGLILQRWHQRSEAINQLHQAEIFTLPGGGASWSANWMVPEEDGIFLAAKFLHLLQGITSREYDELPAALLQTYQRFRSTHGDVPTPLVATTLGIEHLNYTDTLLLKAASANTSKSKKAVIFLHGFGGNWTLLCFLVSEAGREAGYDTLCPSVGFAGMWGSGSGVERLRLTVEEAKRRDYQELVLIGLSNGAVGASILAAAEKLEGRDSFKALGLLFGAHPDTESLTIPTLYIYGSKDERFPPNWLRSFAENHQKKAGPELVKIHSLPVDHFALIKEDSQVKALLQDWLVSLN